MPRKHQRGAVTLPRGVHRVIARGREYLYFQAGRGTKIQGPRIPLPKDVHAPDFWIALRKAQGVEADAGITTVNMVLDLYFVSSQFRATSQGTQQQYRQSAKHVRKAWGMLAAAGLEPHHVQALIDSLAHIPGAANNVIGFLTALSKWGCVRKHLKSPLTHGVTGYESEGGHKPWTPEQCAAAEKHFTGLVRRAYFLARHTGQRGSDVIRMGETFIDDGGFRLSQKKTDVAVWIPIEPALAAEMATWERRPGPFVPMAKKTFEDHFAKQRDQIPELAGATFHGLRGTRVVELRLRGHDHLEIEAQVGMSLQTIKRYCRFADKKKLGKAAVLNLAQARKKR